MIYGFTQLHIPPGYTEEEIVEIINRISGHLAYKFRFGYHTIEDMKQQAALYAWQGLENYDGVRPLENFLWVHIHNRLYNFKRNNYGRPTLPCENCHRKEGECNIDTCPIYKRWLQRNQVKKNLMNSRTNDKDEAMTNDLEDHAFTNEIFKLVEKNIPVSMREDWLRFIHKTKLQKNKREALLQYIMNILADNGIEI